MNWIIFFTKNRISYYVYKLNQGDSIILHKRKYSNTFIVLTGIISLVRVFCNREILPLAVLSNNDIITNHKNKRINCRITALKTTYIIKVMNKKNVETFYEKRIIEYYEDTINRCEEIINLMNQQNKRRRILVFILLIFLRFGKIKQYSILIPFKLTKNCIAIMTATGINTVSKVVKKKYIDEKGKIKSISIKNLKLI